MVKWFRKLTFDLYFDCEAEDRDATKGGVGWHPIELEEPVIYDSKENAEELGGPLDEWANAWAEYLAYKKAEEYCGTDTIHPMNVDWKNVVGEEGPVEEIVPVPTVPADVLASIARLENRKKRVAESIQAVIQYEIDLLKKKYGIK